MLLKVLENNKNMTNKVKHRDDILSTILVILQWHFNIIILWKKHIVCNNFIRVK